MSTATAPSNIKEISANPFVANNLVAPNPLQDVLQNIDDEDIAPEEKAHYLQLIEEAPKELYPLQTEAWINMQLVVEAGLTLPIAQGSFNEKYGYFEEKDNIDDAIRIFQDLNVLLDKFGNPTSISAQIDRFTNLKSDPPDAIFAHAAWLARQTEAAAEDISLNFGDLVEILPTLSSIEDRNECLKGFMITKGGIADKAEDMAQKCDVFMQKIATYFRELAYKLKNKDNNGEIDSLAKYLDQEENVLQAAENDLKDIQTELSLLEEKIKSLKSKLIGFGVGTGVGAASTVLPPFFVIQGAILTAIFAPLLTKIKIALKNAEKKKRELGVEADKKHQLVVEVKALNEASHDIDEKGELFLNAVGEMKIGWTTLTGDLNRIVDTVSPEELANINEWKEFSKMKLASGLWKNVMKNANAFVHTGVLYKE